MVGRRVVSDITPFFTMPTNKQAITRYALIDRMLANRHRAYSIQDITDVLNEKLPDFGQKPVSKRCIEKDLNYLEYDSPFGVDIEEYWVDAADKNDKPYRKRCIRYSDPTFSIFKPKFTDEEKGVLCVALDTLGSFDGLENFEWLSDLKNRLNLGDRASIVTWSKNLLENSTLFARLFTAIKLNLVVKLDYITFNKRDVRSVLLTPHMLKEYNTRWFLVGSASDTGKILTFALDRITDFTIDYTHKPIASPDNISERYEEIIGVTYFENHPLIEIEFWVSDKSKDYVDTKPLHGSQTPIRGNREKVLRSSYPELVSGNFYKVECRENYELIRELSSFGPELIVISPDDIRNKIFSRLELMYNKYKNLQE